MKFLSDILIKAGLVVEGSSTLQSLAGTGTRMVVANAAGLVSTQAIPVTSVSGTGGYGGLTLSGTVTSTGSLTLGGTPTGTWPISITGNAATVTIANTNVNASYYIPLVSSAGNVSLLIDGGNDLNYNPFTNVFTIGGSIVINSVVINGGTANQFMKANGTLDSNTYMTGSGVAGRVAIWDSASNLTGSNSLLYDTSTGNLSIGGSGSSYRLNVLGVGDSLIGQVITSTSGRINIYPYHSATYGGLMESRNLLDTASQPITLSGSNVILLGSSATVTSLAGSGVRMVVTDASGILSSQAIPVSSVTSVFGRTGAVVSQAGDYTTTQVTEGTNLYFTNARSRSAITLTTTGTSGASTYDSVNGILNIPSYVGGVTSVNGLTGAVTLTTTNIAEGTNLYYTDARARAAISLTTTGSSGAATYSAGVLNVPNYTLSGLSGSTGVSGQVAYWTGASSQGSSSNLFWDAASNNLGIGTNSVNATWKLGVSGNVQLGGALSFGTLTANSSTGYIQVSASAMDVYAHTSRVLTFSANAAERGRFHTNGNFTIGAITDTTERLQVVGTAKITDATSIAGVLTVTNRITAGDAQATAGSVVLRSTYSSGNMSNIGTNGSSGGMSINYAVYPASISTADAYLSGIGFQANPRSSYVVEADHRWLSASAAIVAEGSAVTMTENMRLYNSGNLVIQNGGTYADTGDRLQVTGIVRVAGGPVRVVAPTNTEDGNFLLDLVRPNGGKIVSIKDQALIEIGNNNFIHPSTGVNGGISRSVSGLFIGHKEATTQSTGIFHLNLGRPNNINNQVTATAEQGGLVQIIGQFNPNTAVSTPFTSLYVRPTINQTGGANGTTRGLYINPTLTAADWRSIEWSNNTGYGLYGSGTAQNLLNGKLTVSHTVTTGAFANANTMGVFGSQVLNIPAGTQGVAGAVYAANSGFHYFRFNGNTTLVGDALWAASISVANLQFDTAGTITLPDGAGGGSRPRALSGMQIQMQSAGNNNGTISRAAGLLIQGCYPSTGTGVTTFTDFAGIRINDLTEWGTARITMTDRWGIYQAGVDDKNYFNGAVLIGTASPTGEKLQVSGTMRVTGAVKLSGLPTSATGLAAGDIWNDLGTLKIV